MVLVSSRYLSITRMPLRSRSIVGEDREVDHGPEKIAFDARPFGRGREALETEQQLVPVLGLASDDQLGGAPLLFPSEAAGLLGSRHGAAAEQAAAFALSREVAYTRITASRVAVPMRPRQRSQR